MTTDMTRYETEWARQRDRKVPANHLPVHRWYLRHDTPWEATRLPAPREGLSLRRETKPTAHFYRALYHPAGEEFLWGDRRRLTDDELTSLIGKDDCHVMVLYDQETPAGFFEAKFHAGGENEIKYFALMPGFLGAGLGGYLLGEAIAYCSDTRRTTLILDTCTLDHPVALENYLARGFTIYREDDESYRDPRLDGTIPPDAGQHVPPAVTGGRERD